MHMFPLGRVVYMPLSTSTSTVPPATLLGHVPPDFSSPPTIPLYNTTLLSNPFNLCTTAKFEHNALQQTLPTIPHGYKRPRDDLHDSPQQQQVWARKRSKISPTQTSTSSTNQSLTTSNSNDSTSPSSKNALMLLHELKPSVEYKLVAQTGPSHRPIFTMAVEVNGQVFEGMAQTKKEAKQAAAEKALRSFADLPFQLSDDVPIEPETTTTTTAAAATTTTTITNTDIDMTNLNASSTTLNTDDILRTTSSPMVVEPREIQSGLSPLYLLNQLKRDALFEEITDDALSSSETANEQREFKFAITVDGQRFVGSGRSKKIAKTKAAQLILEKLFGMCFDKEGGTPIESDLLPADLPYSRRDLADRIASSIQEKFNQLTYNDVRLQRRKVLAGVVVTRDFNLDTIEVICVTTGTKCISGDRLTLNGESLNDCHAEIISRRCLIRYCYQQLKLLIEENNSESIFERIPNTDRFQLKSSIAFHLYISTSPCGDGRLFAPQEPNSEQPPSKVSNSDPNSKQNGHSLRKSRGLLRTKIEAGEGTIPVMAKTLYQSMQTWDGILGGERLLTMSCSDKLCRWNFIGLQGALLSTLIEPIYYTSIIIGSLYHSEHIRRALFARIEHVSNNIPSPYGLHRPFISGVSSPEMRTTSRAPNHAFIWNCVDQRCEIVDTFSGLTTTRESSVVSKASLFQQWLILMKKVHPDSSPPTIYCDAKQSALDYQTAKVEISKAFQKGGFGLWIMKPHEQDEFDLSSSDEILPEQINPSIPSADEN
ncbi:unnamed protein product [Adineta ricciae]|uniref:Double-stranded RNA-specific editase 1 n=1 Tax=Adineta ricciae TaxID=249248 RepID=A0A815HSK3_ADIRI|nr:unnamed protein product [Adineta ricciae]